MADATLSEQEMVDILEEIARDGGNAAARIAAIKTLREIGAEKPPADGFEGLDQVAERRNRRKAS